MGRIFQINVSDGGVPKLARQAAQVTPDGIAGDLHRSANIHGGMERALCIYPLELILALQAEGHPVFPGAMGENLTLCDVEWAQIQPGTCLQLGEQVEVEVTRFTHPCNNMRPYFLEGDYGRISQSQNPGWSRVYARVIREGEIRVGDRVRILGAG